jgi:hypothetical protein
MSDSQEQEKTKRTPRALPIERLVYTKEAAGIIGEHPITAHNKSNPAHPSFDPDHPRPVKGPKGAPSRWWLPDLYQYVEVLRRRSSSSAEREAR